MKLHRTHTIVVFALCAIFAALSTAYAGDPRPSWNDGAAKKNIVEFVAKVTTEGSPDFVPAPERIATSDNDGTLWAEQPLYFQLIFTLERVKALAGGEKAVREDRHGDASRHADRGVREDRQGLDRHGETSEDQASFH